MSSSARLRWSYPVMLVIWIATAVIAIGPTLMASSALTPGPGPDPSGGLVLEAVFAGRRTIGASSIALLSALLVLWLASPALSLAWLNALSRPSTLSEAMARGARRYLTAVLATIALFPVLLLAMGLTAGLAWAVDVALAGADEPTHDLAVIVAAVPGLGALAVWATWHDLARARIAVGTEGGWSATVGALHRLRLGAVARYAAFFLAATVLGAVGLVVTGSIESAVAVVAGQLFVLARLTVRGFYLAGLVSD